MPSTVSLEEQYEDLLRRFQIMDAERKATYDAAQHAIRYNKGLLKQLKEENQQIRAQLKEMKKSKILTEPEHMQRKMEEVSRQRLQLDQMKNTNVRHKQTLTQLQDKLKELELAAERPTTDASPELRHIRIIENRLDQATIKYNEALSIRSTFEQILKRLKEERLGLDQQLAALEKVIREKEREYEELLSLSHDATDASELAQAELHRMMQTIEKERANREVEVQEKRALVQACVSAKNKSAEQEAPLKEKCEEEAREDGAMARESSSNGAEKADEPTLEDYENVFRRIKEATGVSDVNEVIQKYLMQGETRDNLVALATEHQEKIQALQQNRQRTQAKLDEMKLSLVTNHSKWPVVDDLEMSAAQANARHERARLKYEKSCQLLVDLHAGLDHIYETLTAVAPGQGCLPDPLPAQPSVEQIVKACLRKLEFFLPQTTPGLIEMERRQEEEERLAGESLERLQRADAALDEDAKGTDFDENAQALEEGQIDSSDGQREEEQLDKQCPHLVTGSPEMHQSAHGSAGGEPLECHCGDGGPIPESQCEERGEGLEFTGEDAEAANSEGRPAKEVHEQTAEDTHKENETSTGGEKVNEEQVNEESVRRESDNNQATTGAKEEDEAEGKQRGSQEATQQEDSQAGYDEGCDHREVPMEISEVDPPGQNEDTRVADGTVSDNRRPTRDDVESREDDKGGLPSQTPQTPASLSEGPTAYKAQHVIGEAANGEERKEDMALNIQEKSQNADVGSPSDIVDRGEPHASTIPLQQHEQHEQQHLEHQQVPAGEEQEQYQQPQQQERYKQQEEEEQQQHHTPQQEQLGQEQREQEQREQEQREQEQREQEQHEQEQREKEQREQEQREQEQREQEQREQAQVEQAQGDQEQPDATSEGDARQSNPFKHADESSTLPSEQRQEEDLRLQSATPMEPLREDDSTPGGEVLPSSGAATSPQAAENDEHFGDFSPAEGGVEEKNADLTSAAQPLPELASSEDHGTAVHGKELNNAEEELDVVQHPQQEVSNAIEQETRREETAAENHSHQCTESSGDGEALHTGEIGPLPHAEEFSHQQWVSSQSQTVKNDEDEDIAHEMSPHHAESLRTPDDGLLPSSGSARLSSFELTASKEEGNNVPLGVPHVGEEPAVDTQEDASAAALAGVGAQEGAPDVSPTAEDTRGETPADAQEIVSGTSPLVAAGAQEDADVRASFVADAKEEEAAADAPHDDPNVSMLVVADGGEEEAAEGADVQEHLRERLPGTLTLREEATVDGHDNTEEAEAQQGPPLETDEVSSSINGENTSQVYREEMLCENNPAKEESATAINSIRQSEDAQAAENSSATVVPPPTEPAHAETATIEQQESTAEAAASQPEQPEERQQTDRQEGCLQL